MAQDWLPEPLNQEKSRSQSAVLLPDSTILLSSDRAKEGFFSCYRFEFEAGKWIERPSRLSALINSLVYTQGELFFRFNEDYSRITVTFQSGLKTQPNRFYEGAISDGKWEFYEILKDHGLTIWHNMSLSKDGQLLFVKDSKGQLYYFERGVEGWGQANRLTIFDQNVQSIDEVVSLNNDILIIRGSVEVSKGQFTDVWFLSENKQDRWTAPVNIGEFSGRNVSFVPGLHEQIFDANGKIGRTPYPVLMRDFLSFRVDEESSGRRNSLYATKDDGNRLKLPYPINTEHQDLSGALLPDSSFLIYSGRSEDEKAFRFTYNGEQWVSSPNSLTRSLNSLMISKSHIHFRFSPGFDKLVVNLHSDNQKFFESKKVNGQWSYFKEILKGNDFDDSNAPFSYSSDNSRLYVAPNRKPLNEFQIYEEVSGEWVLQKKVTAFDNFSRIYSVIGVGDNGVLIYGSPKEKKIAEYYLTEELPNGDWTAPLYVRGLDPDYTDLAFTAFDNKLISSTWSEMDLYLIDYPPIIRDKMNSLKKEFIATREEPGLNNREEPKSKIIKPGGEYYALLIGNSDYQNDELDLDRPTQDVAALKRTLNEYYEFEEDNIITLFNGDRGTILNELYKLRNTIGEKDNLLIFYAGHGYWDKEVQQGYWWPIDAVADNPSNWLSNSDLREQIRGIKSAHTLLISDACFSGGIFKTRGTEELYKAGLDIQLLYRMKSRRAITSGTLTTVPDKSVFLKYLNQYLMENQKDFISSSDLFNKVRISVMSNSMTVPQDGVIMDTDDQGGDFIFIRRNK